MKINNDVLISLPRERLFKLSSFFIRFEATSSGSPMQNLISKDALLVGYWQVQRTSGMCGDNNQTVSWQRRVLAAGIPLWRRLGRSFISRARNVLPRSPIRVWRSSRSTFVTPKRPNWRSPSAGTAVCERNCNKIRKTRAYLRTHARTHARTGMR